MTRQPACDGAPGLLHVEAEELAAAVALRAREQPPRGMRPVRDGRAGSRAGRSSRRRGGARPASSTISGERSPTGCRSRAGITSSVTRSIPWSSSQSRISAQRSNVAGSMPWMATAIVPPALAAARASAGARAHQDGHGRRGPTGAAAEPRSKRRSALDARQAARPLDPRPAARGRRELGGSRRRALAASAPSVHRAPQRSAEPARRSRSSGEPASSSTASASASACGSQQQAADAVLDQRQRASLGDGHDRQSARLCLEDDLAERVGRAREQEHVGARVGAGELAALEPSQERGVLAEPLAQDVLLRAAARRARGAGGARARAPCRKASASRSTPFSLRDAPGVQDVDLARQSAGVARAPGQSARCPRRGPSA